MASLINLVKRSGSLSAKLEGNLVLDYRNTVRTEVESKTGRTFTRSLRTCIKFNRT